MRITGGRARGITLRAPVGSLEVRPATDRGREAVFASIGTRVEGARVLDLFAGSGAYGLEALSRGAAAIVFVEQSRRAIDCLRQNIAAVGKSLGCQDGSSLCRVVKGDVFPGGWWQQGGYTLCFADPPYALYDDPRTLPRLFALATTALTPGGWLVVEMPGGMAAEGLGWEEFRRFGKDRHGPSVRLLQQAKNHGKLD